jgi:hypothetical protein
MVACGYRDNRYLINEIVVGEESDMDMFGKRKSHFEMYVDAMIQSGANIKSINSLVSEIKSGIPIQDAIKHSYVPHSAQNFMQFTFGVIERNKPHLMASVFTFGREI